MSEQKLSGLEEFSSQLICLSDLNKQVRKFLFDIWDQERSGVSKKPDQQLVGRLSLQMVLLERCGESKCHGLMSFLTSLGLPDQLWQAGYCLWAHSDHAIRSYISAKDKLLTQLTALGSSRVIPGTVVDTLMDLKRHHSQLVQFGVLAADSDFVDIMRGLKAYCSPEILSELIDQQLSFQHYGELRQALLTSLRQENQPLTAEQMELVDELVLSQQALAQSGIVVNQSQDIGDLVGHLQQNCVLLTSLKEHLSQNHGIEEIILDSADLVEEEEPVKSRLPFSFLTSKAFRLPASPQLASQSKIVASLRLVGAAAAIAILAFACLMGRTAAERNFLSNIEETPVTAEFDDVQDNEIEMMAFDEADGI